MFPSLVVAAPALSSALKKKKKQFMKNVIGSSPFFQRSLSVARWQTQSTVR